MSKFKVGDRVRLLSDAQTEGGQCDRDFGRAGEVGVIGMSGGSWNGIHGWYVDGVGRFECGWFADEQLEHVGAPVQPVAHPTVTAAHAAIDRLVTHLEREATEHVHALDALRAECESLRTINGNLREEVARLTHLVEESRKIHEANASVDLG